MKRVPATRVTPLKPLRPAHMGSSTSALDEFALDAVRCQIAHSRRLHAGACLARWARGVLTRRRYKRVRRRTLQLLGKHLKAWHVAVAARRLHRRQMALRVWRRLQEEVEDTARTRLAIAELFVQSVRSGTVSNLLYHIMFSDKGSAVVATSTLRRRSSMAPSIRRGFSQGLMAATCPASFASQTYQVSSSDGTEHTPRTSEVGDVLGALQLNAVSVDSVEDELSCASSASIASDTSLWGSPAAKQPRRPTEAVESSARSGGWLAPGTSSVLRTAYFEAFTGSLQHKLMQFESRQNMNKIKTAQEARARMVQHSQHAQAVANAIAGPTGDGATSQALEYTAEAPEQMNIPHLKKHHAEYMLSELDVLMKRELQRRVLHALQRFTRARCLARLRAGERLAAVAARVLQSTGTLLSAGHLWGRDLLRPILSQWGAVARYRAWARAGAPAGQLGWQVMPAPELVHSCRFFRGGLEAELLSLQLAPAAPSSVTAQSLAALEAASKPPPRPTASPGLRRAFSVAAMKSPTKGHGLLQAWRPPAPERRALGLLQLEEETAPVHAPTTAGTAVGGRLPKQRRASFRSPPAAPSALSLQVQQSQGGHPGALPPIQRSLQLMLQAFRAWREEASECRFERFFGKLAVMRQTRRMRRMAFDAWLQHARQRSKGRFHLRHIFLRWRGVWAHRKRTRDAGAAIAQSTRARYIQQASRQWQRQLIFSACLRLAAPLRLLGVAHLPALGHKALPQIDAAPAALDLWGALDELQCCQGLWVDAQHSSSVFGHAPSAVAALPPVIASESGEEVQHALSDVPGQPEQPTTSDEMAATQATGAPMDNPLAFGQLVCGDANPILALTGPGPGLQQGGEALATLQGEENVQHLAAALGIKVRDALASSALSLMGPATAARDAALGMGAWHPLAQVSAHLAGSTTGPVPGVNINGHLHIRTAAHDTAGWPKRFAAERSAQLCASLLLPSASAAFAVQYVFVRWRALAARKKLWRKVAYEQLSTARRTMLSTCFAALKGLAQRRGGARHRDARSALCPLWPKLDVASSTEAYIRATGQPCGREGGQRPAPAAGHVATQHAHLMQQWLLGKTTWQVSKPQLHGLHHDDSSTVPAADAPLEQTGTGALAGFPRPATGSAQRSTRDPEQTSTQHTRSGLPARLLQQRLIRLQRLAACGGVNVRCPIDDPPAPTLPSSPQARLSGQGAHAASHEDAFSTDHHPNGTQTGVTSVQGAVLPAVCGRPEQPHELDLAGREGSQGTMRESTTLSVAVVVGSDLPSALHVAAHDCEVRALLLSCAHLAPEQLMARLVQGDINGDTPLHLAAQSREEPSTVLATVRQLLRMGAPLEATNKAGQCAADCAERQPVSDLLKGRAARLHSGDFSHAEKIEFQDAFVGSMLQGLSTRQLWRLLVAWTAARAADVAAEARLTLVTPVLQPIHDAVQRHSTLQHDFKLAQQAADGQQLSATERLNSQWRALDKLKKAYRSIESLKLQRSHAVAQHRLSAQSALRRAAQVRRAVLVLSGHARVLRRQMTNIHHTQWSSAFTSILSTAVGAFSSRRRLLQVLHGVRGACATGQRQQQSGDKMQLGDAVKQGRANSGAALQTAGVGVKAAGSSLAGQGQGHATRVAADKTASAGAHAYYHAIGPSVDNLLQPRFVQGCVRRLQALVGATTKQRCTLNNWPTRSAARLLALLDSMTEHLPSFQRLAHSFNLHFGGGGARAKQQACYSTARWMLALEACAAFSQRAIAQQGLIEALQDGQASDSIACLQLCDAMVSSSSMALSFLHHVPVACLRDNGAFDHFGGEQPWPAVSFSVILCDLPVVVHADGEYFSVERFIRRMSRAAHAYSV